jgi:hypothetical protein
LISKLHRCRNVAKRAGLPGGAWLAVFAMVALLALPVARVLAADEAGNSSAS